MLLETIYNGNLPPIAMSGLLARNQKVEAELQEKRNDPQTKEEVKPEIDRQLQNAQEVIEAIKKKMGN